MIEYLTAICLILLCFGHAILIHATKSFAKERVAGMATLEDRLATLATLMDEGLDMLAGSDAPASPLTHAPFDFKEMLTAALISKIGMGGEHGSQTEPEDRSYDEIEQKQNEQVQGSGIGSSDISDSS